MALRRSLCCPISVRCLLAELSREEADDDEDAEEEEEDSDKKVAEDEEEEDKSCLCSSLVGA